MNRDILKTYQYWTTEEENLLRKLAGTMNFPTMQREFFPCKTPISLQKKSIKMGLISGFRRKLYSHDDNFWQNPNMVNSYWAGFSAADASLQKKRRAFIIQIQRGDEAHLQKLLDAVRFSGDIRYEKTYPTLKICSCHQWYKDLSEIWSITPAKTFTLQPPKITDGTLIKAYIIGIIDGDGWVSVRRDGGRLRIGIVNASIDILNWLKCQIESFFPYMDKVAQVDTQPLRIRQRKGERCFELCIGGIRALRIYHQLRQLPVPRMSRKWDKPELLAQIEKDKLKYPQFFLDNNSALV